MKRKGELFKRLGIIISVILTVFWLIPYIYVICCSFKPGEEVIAVPPKFFPEVFSVENFLGLFERMDAFHFLINSLTAAVCSTVIALILGSLAAYAIQRSGARLSIVLIVLVLCLKMIPTSSIVVPIYELICDLGLYDTQLALIIVYAAVNMPFVMWTMLSFTRGSRPRWTRRHMWTEPAVFRLSEKLFCQSVHRGLQQHLYLLYSWHGMISCLRCF